MGHDITAYIKTKDGSSKSEVAYFRIGAFNNLRRKLFYGTLNNSEEANGGVSGNGSILTFTRKDIDIAKEGCKYYLNDIDALKEFILEKHNEQVECNMKKFKELIILVFGEEQEEASVATEESVEEIKENLVDIIMFHHKILSADDDAALRNNVKIEIEFD
jgi:hypothetical protein